MKKTDQKIIWEPNEGPQEALLTSPVPEVFYGGARGGGKTDGLLGDFAAHAGEHKEYARGIIFRRTLPEFREIELRSLEIYKPLGAIYRKSDREWVFPNGARLVMRYLYDLSDAANYQGHSYTWIGVDEAGNYPSPEPIDLMRATLRSAHGVPVYMRLTGNPGGPGHLWLKARYIDPAPPFHVHEYAPQDERPDLTVQATFIPSTLEDNPYLGMDYEARLAAAGGPALFRAWRYGDWNAIIGAAFSEWRTEVHVRKLDKLDDEWEMVAGGDWGYSSPGSLYLGARNPETEELYVFHEYYFNNEKNQPGTPPEDVGYEFGTQLLALRKTDQIKRYPKYIAFDADAFAHGDGRGGRWQSIADMLQLGINKALGASTVPVIAAPKGRGSRKIRKQHIHQMLKFDVDEQGNIPEWMGPKLRFHPRCVHAIRTIPALPVDPNDPEDVDTDAEDHAYDGIGYMVMASKQPGVGRDVKIAETFDQHPGLESSGKRKKKPWEDEWDGTKRIEVVSKWERPPRGISQGSAGPVHIPG